MELKLKVETLVGWVKEYREHGLDPKRDPKRLDDVVVYLNVVLTDPNGYTPKEVFETLRTYLGDGPEVEDNWGTTDEWTLKGLIGYMSDRVRELTR